MAEKVRKNGNSKSFLCLHGPKPHLECRFYPIFFLHIAAIGGGNRSTQQKPQVTGNFLTCPRGGFEPRKWWETTSSHSQWQCRLRLYNHQGRSSVSETAISQWQCLTTRPSRQALPKPQGLLLILAVSKFMAYSLCIFYTTCIKLSYIFVFGASQIPSEVFVLIVFSVFPSWVIIDLWFYFLFMFFS